MNRPRARVLSDLTPSGLDWLWFCQAPFCPDDGEHRTHDEAIQAATAHVRERHGAYVREEC